MSPFLSTSHCDFNGACLCTHARRTIVSYVTTVLVPSLFKISISQSSPSHLHVLPHHFFCFFSIFITHFSGASAWAYVNPGKNTLSVHTLESNNYTWCISSWISTKLTSVLLLYMLHPWNNFQPKANTWMYLKETSSYTVGWLFS